jgi:hypothetical protein
MYLIETGCEDVDWVKLVEDKVQLWTLVNMVLNLPIP